MSKTKIKKVCKYCGSENVLFDAYARWDINKQELVLLSTTEDHYCEDCDGETTIIDEEIITETPLDQSPGKLSPGAQKLFGSMEIEFSTYNAEEAIKHMQSIKMVVSNEKIAIEEAIATRTEIEAYKAFIKKYDQDDQETN